MLYKTGPGSAFLQYVKAQILKIFPLTTNHGGAFNSTQKNSGYVTGWPHSQLWQLKKQIQKPSFDW